MPPLEHDQTDNRRTCSASNLQQGSRWLAGETLPGLTGAVLGIEVRLALSIALRDVEGGIAILKGESVAVRAATRRIHPDVVASRSVAY